MSKRQKRQLRSADEQVLVDRTRDLEAAYARLQEIDRLKSDFLSLVAHELRTPLTSICSFSEILLSYSDVGLPECRRFLRIINDEGMRLTRLVSQVLDLSKIESGKMDWHFDRLRVGDVIASSLEIAEPLASRVGLSLSVAVEGDLPPVWADRDRLIQVLTNLLSNAVKISPVGERIRVGAHQEGNEVLFQVADGGPGLDLESQKVIFDKFAQIDRYPSGKSDGLGLGLYICREIVEHHGGKIGVHSVPGQGATFSFTIPIAVEGR